MFKVRPAQAQDIEVAVAALGDAFADDPLMSYFFGQDPHGVRAGTMAFFSILLGARIAMTMPALIAEHEGTVVGAAMGYDTSPPAWPIAYSQAWQKLETDIPGLADRLAAYDDIADIHRPADNHYYLGVIGVHPSVQGKGLGKEMLDAFCSASRADPKSRGVFLETASPASLQFYDRQGFERRGQGYLDTTPLWCLFKPT